MTRSVELVFFEGCPNAQHARENIRTALASLGLREAWQEWDQKGTDVPDHVRGYGSPTVLVDGKDVTGGGAVGGMALACRADGPPAVEVIATALR